MDPGCTFSESVLENLGPAFGKKIDSFFFFFASKNGDLRKYRPVVLYIYFGYGTVSYSQSLQWTGFVVFGCQNQFSIITNWAQLPCCLSKLFWTENQHLCLGHGATADKKLPQRVQSYTQPQLWATESVLWFIFPRFSLAMFTSWNLKSHQCHFSKFMLEVWASYSPSSCQASIVLSFLPSPKMSVFSRDGYGSDQHYVSQCDDEEEGSGLIKSLNEEVTK